MCIHPTVLHELNWVPQASNPDLTRAKLPSRGISLSIDYREASATESYLHSDEFFLLLALFLRVKVCCASGHISLAEHPSWSQILIVLKKRIPTSAWPSILHAESGLNSPVLRGEKLHAACRDGNNDQIQNANNPKFTPTALSGRYDTKSPETGIAFWAIPLPKSLTSQAGSQTTYATRNTIFHKYTSHYSSSCGKGHGA